MGCGASLHRIHQDQRGICVTLVTPLDLDFEDEEDNKLDRRRSKSFVDYEVGWTSKAAQQFGGFDPPSPTSSTRAESDEFRVMRVSNLSGQVTLYVAGGKHKKPVQYEAGRACPRAADQPFISDRCPFCPGQEAKTPISVLRFDSEGNVLPEGHDGGDWDVRVFPNIFPMLICPLALYGAAHEEKLHTIPHSVVARGVHANHKVDTGVDLPIFHQVDAVGASEVVVESQKHNALLALQPPESIELMLRALISRGKVLSEQAWAKQLLFFKQYGPLSGGSLVHPHTQIVSLPVMPPPLLSRLEYSLYALTTNKRCATCMALVDPFLKFAADSPRNLLGFQPVDVGDDTCSRVVHITEHFVVSVPYASSSQYCMTVAPRRHVADFLESTPEELEDLARVLALLSQSIYVGLDDPSYNIFIRTAPCSNSLRIRGREVSKQELADAFHWILEFRPRFPADVGGFEIASGVRVVTGLPEDHAEQLRGFLKDRLNAGMPPIKAAEELERVKGSASANVSKEPIVSRGTGFFGRQTSTSTGRMFSLGSQGRPPSKQAWTTSKTPSELC
eukprot:gb/GFBE01081048.1/.p1 GENE.gb/GFBE01081048.1/~~gb/GFBE01081048.1/.p1  ORF type:complete len:561 (+),score=94.65 gb/GFBE01081048.1/:1-1683(+)